MKMLIQCDPGEMPTPQEDGSRRCEEVEIVILDPKLSPTEYQQKALSMQRQGFLVFNPIAQLYNRDFVDYYCYDWETEDPAHCCVARSVRAVGDERQWAN